MNFGSQLYSSSIPSAAIDGLKSRLVYWVPLSTLSVRPGRAGAAAAVALFTAIMASRRVALSSRTNASHCQVKTSTTLKQ